MTEWVIMTEGPPADDRPVYGPRCPGPYLHVWKLGVEEGRVSVSSGCPDCDEATVGTEDVFMEPVPGKLVLHHLRVGWPPEHSFWWEFLPLPTEGQ